MHLNQRYGLTRMLKHQTHRRNIVAAGLGLAGLGLGSSARAQGATPVATPGAAPTSWLFVMTFQEAVLTWSPPLPASGQLILRDLDEHVLTFADRPAREWTLVPVEDMARDIGQQQQNPYNAVLGGVPGDGEAPWLWVVVLLSASWDPASGQFTLDIQVMGEHADDRDQSGEDSSEVLLGDGYLFIDSKNNHLLGPGGG